LRKHITDLGYDTQGGRHEETGPTEVRNLFDALVQQRVRLSNVSLYHATLSELQEILQIAKRFDHPLSKADTLHLRLRALSDDRIPPEARQAWTKMMDMVRDLHIDTKVVEHGPLSVAKAFL
jgi:hypothetical protein